MLTLPSVLHVNTKSAELAFQHLPERHKNVIPTIFLLFRAFYYFSTTSESLSFVLGLTADQYRGFLYRGIQVVESVLLCLSYCEDNEFSL